MITADGVALAPWLADVPLIPPETASTVEIQGKNLEEILAIPWKLGYFSPQYRPTKFSFELKYKLFVYRDGSQQKSERSNFYFFLVCVGKCRTDTNNLQE